MGHLGCRGFIHDIKHVIHNKEYNRWDSCVDRVSHRWTKYRHWTTQFKKVRAAEISSKSKTNRFFLILWQCSCCHNDHVTSHRFYSAFLVSAQLVRRDRSVSAPHSRIRLNIEIRQRWRWKGFPSNWKLKCRKQQFWGPVGLQCSSWSRIRVHQRRVLTNKYLTWALMSVIWM